MTPFRRIKHIGDGHFGRVELEYDEGLKRYCAAKYLENTAFVSPDFTEAQAMVLGRHDNVVTVYSTDTEDGTPVIRMEYMKDGSVAKRYGLEAAPVRDALLIMEAACRGIQHIHTVGLLHRDIKPANLLLDDEHTVKVTDFGLACESRDAENSIGVPYFAHLPPESIKDGTGTITSIAGDIYSLGLTTYRLLNSDRRVRPRLETDSSIPHSETWMPYIHQSLRRAVTRALHEDPGKRIQTASDFRHALGNARPRVSWQPDVGQATRHAWTGSSIEGTDWRARISRNSTGHQFTIDRCLPNRAWRAHNADKGIYDTESEALDHAAEVLQRVATEGK
ncbi:serine/threonine-protein kinase [Rhodococcus sp. NM-2]|uniref:serine/threonine-protein kinase n=1 Tax=Rhodococcus sp. NM-2 TaxID=3401174 RepID=UPI003AAC5C90